MLLIIQIITIIHLAFFPPNKQKKSIEADKFNKATQTFCTPKFPHLAFCSAQKAPAILLMYLEEL